MEFTLYYTLGAIILYGATSWLLDRIEEMRGERLKYRNVIFFIILFVLALLAMQFINPPPQSISPNPDTESNSLVR